MTLYQPIIGGSDASLSTSATRYERIYGGFAWETTAGFAWQLVSHAGKIKNLYVRLDGTPGAGKQYAFTLMVNDVASALTCTIADLNTQGSDLINEVNVSPGDRVNLQCVPTGTPTARDAMWTTTFQNDDDDVDSLMLGCGTDAPDTAATEYNPAMGSASWNANEDYMKQPVPIAGTIKYFYVRLSTDSDFGGYTFTLRKNGVDTAITVTITGTLVFTGSDLVNTVAVSPGDLIDIKCEPFGTTLITRVAWGFCFQSGTNFKSIALSAGGGPGFAIPNNFTFATDQDVVTYYKNIIQDSTVSRLFVWISVAVGGGNTLIFIVRKNNVDTLLTCTIPAGNQSANNVVDEANFAAAEYISMRVTYTGGYDATTLAWGAVLEGTAPSPPAGIPLAGIANKLIAERII